MSDSHDARKKRLQAVETELEEAKADYKRKKKALKEKKKAIRKEWTPEEREEHLEKKAARQERKAYRRALSEPPKRPLLEEIGCSVNHGAGAALSVVALVLLLLKADTGLKVFSASIYGGCLLLMFLMSCLYHAFRAGSTVKRIWRRFDYSSIYLLIGGTITPILLLFVGGTLGIVLCVVMWALIATGITFVGVFGPMVARGLHFALFFTIGWSAIVFVPMMWNRSQALFWLILSGGLAYTLGMIPFVRKTKGAHFIWHFFVLAGAVLQWVGIWMIVF
ncbi:MAG: hemolysin III family protein [Clostridia bacterium]|nr:hemolysin III family protein [Clostridia bacterium]